MRVAVVGGGIAGISLAHLLQKKHEVTLFEAGDRLGGHANPVPVPPSRNEEEVWLETAFLIFNELTYPRFMKFISDLGLNSAVQEAEMSASFSFEESTLSFTLSPMASVLLPQLGKLLNPRIRGLLLDLALFRKKAYRDIMNDSPRLREITLSEYLRDYSEEFRERFVPAVAVAIWSIPARQVLSMPASVFIRFFENHHLLHGRSGKGWRSFRGSSQVYLAAFRDRFRGEVLLGCPVSKVSRSENAVAVQTRDEKVRSFDSVAIALHADEALQVLADPSPEESEGLGAFKYFENKAVLHTFDGHLPKGKMRSSWNIRATTTGDFSVTYDLNRVQQIKAKQAYFLTLGNADIPPHAVIRSFRYCHPIFDFAAAQAQEKLGRLNGQRNTFFCGSYFGFGFHEDAVRSAERVAASLNCFFE